MDGVESVDGAALADAAREGIGCSSIGVITDWKGTSGNSRNRPWKR